MDPIRTLLDYTSSSRAPTLLPELRKCYGGDLHFEQPTDGRPYVVGNFVSSIDGIVSYRIPGKAGGGDISGNNEADRFIMGLLRASADAVIVGAGTLQATVPGHEWTPEGIYSQAANVYRDYRKALGKLEPPLTVIATVSGVVDLGRPMFRRSNTAVRIFTTAKGRDRLRAAGADALPATEVIVLDGAEDTIAPAAMLRFLRATSGVRLLLHEGGPTLFGEFVSAGLVDEFFLTIAPRIAGCNLERPRPTMVWGVEFLPETAPALRILSIKQSAEHLFLRYAR